MATPQCSCMNQSWEWAVQSFIKLRSTDGMNFEWTQLKLEDGMTDGSYDGTEVFKRLGSESSNVPMRPVKLGIAVARTQIHVFLDSIQSISPSAPVYWTGIQWM